MDYGEMNRDLREVKTVPWQLTAVVLGVFFGLPGSILGTWCLLEAKGQGSSVLAGIFAVPSYVMLVWGAFGMRSRLKQAAAAGEVVGSVRNKMLGGSALIIGGLAVLSVLSYVADVPGAVIGAMGVFFSVPGLWLIMRAMIPQKCATPYLAGGAIAATGTVPPPTIVPPRPRR